MVYYFSRGSVSITKQNTNQLELWFYEIMKVGELKQKNLTTKNQTLSAVKF